MEISLSFKIVVYLIFLLSLSVHEWGHAFVADLLGDRVARAQGRVTLNPFAHFDPIGTGLVPLMALFAGSGFMLIGWAKPVMISFAHSRHKMRDDLLSTAAGPGMNFIFALLLAPLLGAASVYAPQLTDALYMAIWLNLLLGVFNLIPLPPLDGSHVLPYLGMSWEAYAKISRWSFFILLALILFGRPFWAALSALINALIAPLLKIAELAAGAL